MRSFRAALSVSTLLLFSCAAPPAPPAPPPVEPAGLVEGAEAPDFDLPADDGTTVRLSALRGESPVVLYFYPKDETPGCTKQACAYRDSTAEFARRGIALFGVSVDDTAAHRAFREKERLNFPLLSDVGGEVARRYGVLGGNGRAARTTFLIGRDGRILRIHRDVDPTTDPMRALEALGDADTPAAR